MTENAIADRTVLVASGQAGRASATAAVATRNRDGIGAQRLTVSLEVASPWHVYAPGSADGLPVEISVDAPARIDGIHYDIAADVQTLRRAVIWGEIFDAQPGTTLQIRTQACDGARCEGPAVMRLSLAEVAHLEPA